MSVKIGDVMVAQVMVASPNQTVGHVRKVMEEHRIGCMPVARSDGEPAGIVTTSDLIGTTSETTRISQIMSRNVHTISRYADVAQAASIMRKHRIHHVLVTHEKRIVGVVSTFDLVGLLEDRRFVAKNAPPKPTRTRRTSGGRPETTI